MKMTVAPIFCDHMILQRDTLVRVWGKAQSEVTLSVDGICEKCMPTDGSFELSLPPHEAGGPYTVTVMGDGESMTFSDVYYGDVFIAGGQSNMGLTLADAPQELAETSCPVRMYTPDREWECDRRPRTDMRWVEVCVENADGISAVASHFATELSAARDIPVGIVSCNQGATCIRSWISPETCAADEFFAAAPKFHEDAELFPFNGYSDQYNERLLALAPYTVKGVIWYQGESDCAESIAPHYAYMFDLMVRDWRRIWRDDDLPFITVQLAYYIEYRPDDAWQIVREQQLRASLEGHNIGIVTTGDVGDLNDIHPRDKKTVGKRLARYARGMLYGEDIVYKAPICTRAVRDGDKIVLEFANTGDGLYETQRLSFCVTDKNGNTANPNYTLDNSRIILDATGIDAESVSFAYTTHSDVRLYSSVALPASQFKITL